MKHIKIQNLNDSSWASVAVVDFMSRDDEIQIRAEGQEPEWVHINRVHPADKILISVEKLAGARYEYVPKEDLE